MAVGLISGKTPRADRIDFRQFEAELRSSAETWTQSTVFASSNPDAIAVFSPYGNRTFRALEENANRLANALLQHGLVAGDGVALLCSNRPEFLEVFLATMRIGLRLTPINTHLTPNEVDYIVDNCEAKVFFTMAGAVTHAQLSSSSRFTVVIDGSGEMNRYVDFLASCGCELPVTLVIGSQMLYTSGTTGKPKGVYRDTPEPVMPQFAGTFADYDTTRDVVLCCGPAYHSAPLLFDIRWPLASGVPIVMMEKWDALKVLETIETYGVTHTHMVATMFQRLLVLAAGVRAAKNISSLKLVVHGAAPCPVPVKRAMIDWLGPVLIEYYGATEGGDGIHVNSEDWLKKPGTFGRMDKSLGHVLLDDQLQEVKIGEVGRIYFKAPQSGRFAYFGDSAKTAAAYCGDRFTLGDMGYVDADGFLFLTGRIAECIISGGVNIYPQEVDDVLLTHPAVRDVCTVGIPDAEWGEQVVSLVVARNGYHPDNTLAETLMKYAAEQLASFKRPRQILFEIELPRSASGKLLRKQVRERFWKDQSRAI